MRNAELKYYSDQLEVHKSDLSKSWKIIKDVTGLNNVNSSCLNFNVNGNLTNDKSIIANAFNHFFGSIGSKLSNSIYTTIHSPISHVHSIMHSIVIYIFLYFMNMMLDE